MPSSVAEEDNHPLFGGDAVEGDDPDSVGEDEGESFEDEEDDNEADEEDEEEEHKPLRPAVTVPGDDLVTSSSNGHAPNLTSDPNPTKPSPPDSPSQNGAIRPIRVAPVASLPNAAAAAIVDDEFTTPSPDRKRQKTDTAFSDEKKPAAPAEDSRRLFQRLWTDDDEIVILQGYLEFTSERNSTSNYLQDTGPFYDQIKNRLQLDFNKNQLVEKLRRLKKKYKNIMIKMGSGKEIAFKSPHDQAIFEISRKIWKNCGSRSYDPDEDDPIPLRITADTNTSDDHTLNSDRSALKSRRRIRKRSAAAAAAATAAATATATATAVEGKDNAVLNLTASIPNVVEETVRSCLSPLFKELLYCAVGGPIGQALVGGGGGIGLALSPLQFNCGVGSASLPNSGSAVDEKWRKQQILELEVYLKRVELVHDQIKSTLEELRSLGG